MPKQHTKILQKSSVSGLSLFIPVCDFTIYYEMLCFIPSKSESTQKHSSIFERYRKALLQIFRFLQSKLFYFASFLYKTSITSKASPFYLQAACKYYKYGLQKVKSLKKLFKYASKFLRQYKKACKSIKKQPKTCKKLLFQVLFFRGS